MTGTGTKTDPFIVGSWSEFVAVNTDNYLKFIKFADSDNKNIDFNDISSVGMSKITIRNCVDFNNWTLMNFYSEDTSIFYIDVSNFTGIDWIIKNLNFLNFYHITNKGSFAVGHILDTHVLGGGSVCRSAVIGFYIANEGISILENAGNIGIPLPKKLIDVLKQLKSKEDSEND